MIRNVWVRVIAGIVWLCLSKGAMATVVTQEYLAWVQMGPGGELLVTGTMGSLLSVDGGQTWSWTPPVPDPTAGPLSYEGLMGLSVQQLAEQHHLTWPRGLGPRGGTPAVDRLGRFYRCAKGGTRVEYSDNQGKDWIEAELLDKRYPIVRPIVVNSVTVGTIRETKPGGLDGECRVVSMIGGIPYVLSQEGMYWSEDRGKHWLVNYHFLGARTGGKVFGDGTGALYINHEGPLKDRDGSTKIFQSSDEGKTWTKLVLDLPAEQLTGDVVLLRMHDKALYFVTQPRLPDPPVSLYRSTDGRKAIKLLDIPLRPLRVGLRFFEIGPHGELVVVGGQSVFISTDNGKTWKTIGRDTLWKGPWSWHT